jgi:hypothetical protein
MNLTENVMMSRAGRFVLLLSFALPAAGARAQSASLKDLVFTAVQPCRIYDTRSGSGVQGAGTGPIPAAQTRDIDVSHGAAPSCGISTDARAVVMNIVAVSPAGPGHLVAWPFGTPPPNAAVLNYSNVPGLNIANGIVQPICGPNCTHEFSLVPGVSATHVVIDVMGYFAPPGAGHLWGRGRPGTKIWGPGDLLCVNGTTIYGLSYVAVSWGSAADACPQGTWVCTRAERGTGACNTSRSDGGCDGLTCTGACMDFLENRHYGWTADQVTTLQGWAISELGGAADEDHLTCEGLPVWCCTE